MYVYGICYPQVIPPFWWFSFYLQKQGKPWCLTETVTKNMEKQWLSVFLLYINKTFASLLQVSPISCKYYLCWQYLNRIRKQEITEHLRLEKNIQILCFLCSTLLTKLFFLQKHNQPVTAHLLQKKINQPFLLEKNRIFWC